MPRGNPSKIITGDKRTPQEARENGRKGGIKSGQVRREKKLMSQLYAEFLSKDHEIIGADGYKKKLSGHALLSAVMSKILARGDSAAVSMMREIREATEGNNLNLNTEKIIFELQVPDDLKDE